MTPFIDKVDMPIMIESYIGIDVAKEKESITLFIHKGTHMTPLPEKIILKIFGS